MAVKKTKTKTTDDVLLILWKSVQKVLSQTTKTDIQYSPTVQKITKTCLKPDIGCFVLFEGAFSGLVIINMSAGAAVEIYSNYMKQMGFKDNERLFSALMSEILSKIEHALLIRNGGLPDF